MNTKPRLDDLIIILPGIMGSVLQKNGKDIWGVSRQSIWGVLKTAGSVLETLELDPSRDDPDEDDIGDGVTADRIMPDIHLLPGIAKIDGYSSLTKMIEDKFDVVPGDRNDPAPANLYTFPYDWRRDNRAAARQLKTFVDDRLAVWRSEIGDDSPKVILIAHSMGGLVSRYYLEVLGGAEHARVLFTFGTPFRGSPQALETLSHGMKKGWLDLTDMLRSFTAVYQLLPIYRTVDIGNGEYERIAEIDGIPGVDRTRAEDALAFHRSIEAAVDAGGRNYLTVPYQGFRQSTVESATFSGGRITALRTTPTWIDAGLGGGDGTVPRVSATPIEMSNELRDVFVAEQHGSLQNNGQVLDDLEAQLRTLASSGLGQIRGSEPAPDLEAAPALSIEVDDLFMADEPVTVAAKLVNAKATDAPTATFVNSETETSTQANLASRGDGWFAEVEGLPAGVYRVTVDAPADRKPSPVTDVFEVLP